MVRIQSSPSATSVECSPRLVTEISVIEVTIASRNVRRVRENKVEPLAGDSRIPVALVETDVFGTELGRICPRYRQSVSARVDRYHLHQRPQSGEGDRENTAAGTEVKHLHGNIFGQPSQCCVNQ